MHLVMLLYIQSHTTLQWSPHKKLTINQEEEYKLVDVLRKSQGVCNALFLQPFTHDSFHPSSSVRKAHEFQGKKTRLMVRC